GDVSCELLPLLLQCKLIKLSKRFGPNPKALGITKVHAQSLEIAAFLDLANGRTIVEPKRSPEGSIHIRVFAKVGARLVVEIFFSRLPGMFPETARCSGETARRQAHFGPTVAEQRAVTVQFVVVERMC